MAYVGRGIDNISNASLLDVITFTDSAGPYNLEQGSAAFTPVSVQALVISVDGVIQSPSSYTISAATITFDSVMASTSTNDFIVHNGVGLITEPSDGSVTAAKLATDAVETAKIEDLAVTTAKLAADAVTTAKILDDNVTTAKILDANVTTAKTDLVSTASVAAVTAKGTSGVSDGYVALNCDQNTHGIKLKSPSHSAAQSYTLTFPQTAPATDTYLQTTSGGQLSFATVTEYNDADMRSDIMSVALKQATQENMEKHNLPNAAVVVFQADSDFNLAGSTDISRNSSNYIEATSTSTTTNPVDWSYLRTGNITTVSNATWTNALNDNDRATAGDDSTYYTIGLAHTRVFDLSQDFNFQSFFVDGSGNRTSYDYPNLNVIVSTDTTYAGTEQGAGTIWFDPVSNNNTGTTADWRPSIAQAFTTSVNTALSYSSYAITNVDAGDVSTAVDMNSTSQDFNMYFNDASNYYGHSVVYDASTSTMTMGAVTDTARTVSTKAKITATEVPTTGSVFIGEGNSQIISSKWNSLTYASGTGFSTYDSSTTIPSATGTALGTTNVPAAAVTEVSGVILVKNAFGTNTLGTDVKVYFTADNSNWTEASSYTNSGLFSTGITQYTLGKTTVTSGSDVRWKIEFANQVASTKIAYVYGMGTNY